MKYITIEVDHEHLPIRYGFVFPEEMIHAEMAKYMCHALYRQFPRTTVKVIGAGFISNTWQVYGESESLKLKVAPGDQEVFTYGPRNAAQLKQLAEMGAQIKL